MMHEQGMASLHAGLIERARPRPASAPSVVPLVQRQADPARIMPRLRAELAAAAPQPAEEPPRRYALTVRVEPEVRRDLARLTARTGRTTQAVLHRALQAMLAETRD
ncbi:MAG: hypothetical protein AAGB15_02830 [Pseudomonadota bacterium]